MTLQQLEEKIIELLANAESYEDAMKQLAAYVREETLREVQKKIDEFEKDGEYHTYEELYDYSYSLLIDKKTNESLK